MNFSQGTIKYIYDDFYNIDHVCDSDPGSSGGPLINLVDYKVIGIHKGGALGSKNLNLGSIIKEPIEEYKKKFSKEDIEKMNKLEPKELEPVKKNNKTEEMKKKFENKNNLNIKEVKNKNDENDELLIQYKVEMSEYSKQIRIFGDNFVNNNKALCKIIINNNEFELSDHFNVNNNQLNNGIFEIVLKGLNNISNISHMFKGEQYDNVPLYSLPDISKLDTQKVTDIVSCFMIVKYYQIYQIFQIAY